GRGPAAASGERGVRGGGRGNRAGRAGRIGSQTVSEQGRIYTGDEISSDQELSCDVCVVGSGSGGGVLAHELAAKGLKVILLEEGGYHTRREFDLTEGTAYPRLYQELGNRSTDDLSVQILQ